MPYEQPPRNPVPRDRIVPHTFKHTVKDGESWETLAVRYGLSADEIILANFETVNHAEVNWYLRHYVGCVKTTRDGKNWMFSSGAKHPVILIPPKHYALNLYLDQLDASVPPPPFYELKMRPMRPSIVVPTHKEMLPWQHKNMNIGGVKITTRTEWGALEPAWFNGLIYYNTAAVPLTKMLDTIVVHHTDNQDSIKDVEKSQKGKGYAAIGYHFYIAKNGTIYEGRPLEIMGSHAGEGLKSGPTNDPDWAAIGIVLQGDYHRETGLRKGHKVAEDIVFSSKPPKSQLQSLENLVIALQKTYPVRHLLMHREVPRGGTATECPGDVLVPHIESLREKVNLK